MTIKQPSGRSKDSANILTTIFENHGKDASELRLEQGARVMLAFITPFFTLPASLIHIEFGWLRDSSALARTIATVWLALNVLHLIFISAVLFLGPGHGKTKRALIYASIICQVVTLGLFIHTTGGLMSPLILFLPVMIGSYRVFLDFPIGFAVTWMNIIVFLSVVGLEIFGGYSTQIYFANLNPVFLDYPLASVIAALSIACMVLICFGTINYGVNQSDRLHRYITESVLKRYLPPSLLERAAAGELRLDAPPERRTVTVMFIDLVSFTSLSEHYQPEKVAEILNLYFSTATRLGYRYQATVDKFIGDAVMFVFGAPDVLPPAVQAERAVLLAKDILRELPLLPFEINLKVRIGINTGEAIVGNFGSSVRSDYTVIGHSVNLAARLETACEPGSILIGPETASLLQATFQLQPTERLRLKGISQPIVAFNVALDEVSQEDLAKVSC